MPQRKKQSFEKALERLEHIAEQLESGELNLDQTVRYLEEGMELATFCTKKLQEAEEKIAKLIKKEDGFELKPFSVNKEADREE